MGFIVGFGDVECKNKLDISVTKVIYRLGNNVMYKKEWFVLFGVGGGVVLERVIFELGFGRIKKCYMGEV